MSRRAGSMGGHATSMVTLRPPQKHLWPKKPKPNEPATKQQIDHLEALLPHIELRSCPMKVWEADELMRQTLKYLRQKGTKNRLRLVTTLARLQERSA